LEYSEALVRRFRGQYELRDDMPMSIWERETGRFVGGCGLHRIDWKVRAFEIGYWIRSSSTGKGFMTEATRLLTGLAFETLAANRVFIRVVTDNARSVAIPKRIGYVQEGLHRNAILDAEGALRDLYVFGLTPDEWQALTC
jgi:RimJ/RimL family protein N-acetyltransferase